jgi:hypothetical protein
VRSLSLVSSEIPAWTIVINCQVKCGLPKQGIRCNPYTFVNRECYLHALEDNPYLDYACYHGFATGTS